MKQGTVMAVMMTLGLSLLCTAIQAEQDLDIYYTYSTPSEGELDGKAEQHEITAEGMLKILSDSESSFDVSIGAAVQANSWKFDDEKFDDIDLYKVKLPMMVDFQARQNFLVSVGLTPGIHSDFEDVDEEDIRLAGAVLGTYVQSRELQWVIGVAFGEEFGDPTVYPVLGVNWQATEQLLLELILPSPKVSYAFSEEFRVFAAGEPTGGEWNVGDERSVDIQQKGMRVGLGAECQVVEGGWLYALVGVEVDRELQLAEDGEELLADEVELDDQSFVQVGFRIR